MPRLHSHERDDDLNQASNDPHETEGVGVLVTEALASAQSARRSFTDWFQQQHEEHIALIRSNRQRDARLQCMKGKSLSPATLHPKKPWSGQQDGWSTARYADGSHERRASDVNNRGRVRPASARANVLKNDSIDLRRRPASARDESVGARETETLTSRRSVSSVYTANPRPLSRILQEFHPNGRMRASLSEQKTKGVRDRGTHCRSPQDVTHEAAACAIAQKYLQPIVSKVHYDFDQEPQAHGDDRREQEASSVLVDDARQSSDALLLRSFRLLIGSSHYSLQHAERLKSSSLFGDHISQLSQEVLKGIKSRERARGRELRARENASAREDAFARASVESIAALVSMQEKTKAGRRLSAEEGALLGALEDNLAAAERELACVTGRHCDAEVPRRECSVGAGLDFGDARQHQATCDTRQDDQKDGDALSRGQRMWDDMKDIDEHLACMALLDHAGMAGAGAASDGRSPDAKTKCHAEMPGADAGSVGVSVARRVPVLPLLSLQGKTSADDAEASNARSSDGRTSDARSARSEMGVSALHGSADGRTPEAQCARRAESARLRRDDDLYCCNGDGPRPKVRLGSSGSSRAEPATCHQPSTVTEDWWFRPLPREGEPRHNAACSWIHTHTLSLSRMRTYA